MKGDRQKCLDAGANDYISKPVDIDLLLALIRVWIDRARHAQDGARQRRRADGGCVTIAAEASDRAGRRPRSSSSTMTSATCSR